MISQQDAWEALYKSHPVGLWDRTSDALANRLCKEHKGGAVLEIGCGDGRNLGNLINLKPSGGIVGLDQSYSALNICRDRFGYPEGVVLVCGRIEDKTISLNMFHSILCVDVLGHIENAHAAVNIIYDCMNNGSRLYASLYAPHDVAFSEKKYIVKSETKKQCGEYICSKKADIRYYGRSLNEVKRIFNKFNLLELELREWEESGHGKFRENQHKHSSWSIVAEKL